MVTHQKKPAPKRDMTLPVPGDVRELAEEAMAMGDYGTLTNTIRVALRELKKQLEARTSKAQAST